jgi:oligoendopeptidase F
MLYNFDLDKGLTLDDISTIAHEVGHSMHSYYSEKKQPLPNKDYVIFNAEVASTVNEAIMSMELLEKAWADYNIAKRRDREEKNPETRMKKLELIDLISSAVDNVRQTFYRQTKFATWEWEAHKMAENGEPITKESLSKLYYDLVSEFHGPAMEYEEMSGMSWAQIPHFYRDYYVYTYATSYAASIALALDIRAEYKGDRTKAGATQRFMNFLASGSSKHPVELLKDAGVDMTTSAPIEALIKYNSDLVNELDALTK